MQASSSQIGIDRPSILVKDARTPMIVDDDGESLITPPDPTSKGDTTPVDEDFKNLYIVVRASGSNLYL